MKRKQIPPTVIRAEMTRALRQSELWQKAAADLLMMLVAQLDATRMPADARALLVRAKLETSAGGVISQTTIRALLPFIENLPNELAGLDWREQHRQYENARRRLKKQMRTHQ